MKETIEGQLRNVLICVDGSKHSERAFNFYLSDICKSGDHVILFHAQEMATLPDTPYPYGFVNYDEWSEVMKKVDDNAKLLLQVYGDVLKAKPDLKVKLVNEGGKPGELICKSCKKEGADLVVLGSRGQGVVRRTFLGSVSGYVVHHSHVPVCVVPPGKKH